MPLFVLLIEHNGVLAEQLSGGLRSAGFMVMTLADADESIDLLRLFSFDLVLADIATLRYSTAPQSGLAALLAVIRRAPLLRFTTPLTMDQESTRGALVLEPGSNDLPQLLQAISLLFETSGPSLCWPRAV